MKRLVGLALIVGVLACGLAGASASSASSGQGADEQGRVLIVAVPRLSWTQVESHRISNIKKFLSNSAIGNLSLRTLGPRTSLGEAYATIGAGNRSGTRDADAGRFLEPTERYENGTARAAYERRTGWKAEGDLLQLSIASIRAMNDRYLYGAEPGSLGQAVRDDGRTTLAIGTDDIDLMRPGSIAVDPSAPTGEANEGQNVDEGVAEFLWGSASPALEPLGGENRPAGLALMDRQGQVMAGSVSRTLLRADPAAAFGLRMDENETLKVLDDEWVDRSVGVLELSDLERLDQYRGRVASQEARLLEADALERVDKLFGEVLERATPQDLIIFVSPASPRSAENLTPMAIAGPDFESGTLMSGTTRRGGYVTLPDIAPTILDHLDIDQPTAMTGSPIKASNNNDLSSGRYENFIKLNKATKFRDQTVMRITILTVVAQVVLYILTLVALRRGSTNLRRSAALLGLVTMCLPLSTFVMGLGSSYKLGSWLFLVVILTASGLVACLATIVGSRAPVAKRAVATTMVPVVLTYLLLVADIATGANLQINTIFGYSPLVAGRFAGFGNPAYSLLSMSTVLMACGAWALLDGDKSATRRKQLIGAIVALFLVTIVVDGHPALGSDVGGVLSIVPTAFVVIWLLLGRRIHLRVVAIATIASVVVLGAFAALDLSRPVSQQTHLGRLVRSTFGDGGSAGLITVLGRKISANLTVLQTSTWTWAIPLALVLLVLMIWRRPKVFDGHLPETNAVRATLWGGITLCLLGMAVNDSGISIPAVMFTLFLPTVLYEALTPFELPSQRDTSDLDTQGDLDELSEVSS